VYLVPNKTKRKVSINKITQKEINDKISSYPVELVEFLCGGGKFDDLFANLKETTKININIAIHVFK
jgi:exopolysaccharide biosynthesis predicted pyruvyltransferase EpsI